MGHLFILARSALFWTIVASLSAVLLFLIAPVALTIAFAVIAMFAPGPLGGPWWLILVILFGLPLAVVALIFAGLFRSLRGRS